MKDAQFADCGPFLAPIVRQVVEEAVPDEILDQHDASLFFICMSSRDGLRLTKHVRENFEVIILSDHIAPSHSQINQDDPVFRYFMYTVLHEVAHAVKGHKSRIYDGISAEEGNAQEEEAHGLATEWFNDWANAVGCAPMSDEELAIQQDVNQKAMLALWQKQ
jgi:hypothetical protein